MIREADGAQGSFRPPGIRLDGHEAARAQAFEAKIKVDGASWFNGQASSVLVGNLGKLFGREEAFEDARPDDGKLEARSGDRRWAAESGVEQSPARLSARRARRPSCK